MTRAWLYLVCIVVVGAACAWMGHKVGRSTCKPCVCEMECVAP